MTATTTITFAAHPEALRSLLAGVGEGETIVMLDGDLCRRYPGVRGRDGRVRFAYQYVARVSEPYPYPYAPWRDATNDELDALGVEREVAFTDLKVGQKYRIKPAGHGFLPEGIYRISYLYWLNHEFNVTGRPYSLYCAEFYTFHTVPKVLKVTLTHESETPTQEQLDALYDEGYAKGRADLKRDLSVAAKVFPGERHEGLVEAIRLAKEARLAYWKAIGEPRKSEPKEISLEGWLRAVEAIEGE